MRFACWITKATDTHSEHITLMVFCTVTVVTRTLHNYIIFTLPVLKQTLVRSALYIATKQH